MSWEIENLNGEAVPLASEQTSTHEPRPLRNAPGHDATSDALRKVVARLEEMHRQGDISELVREIEQNPLASYFGLQPEVFQGMLEQIAESGTDTIGLVEGFLFLFPNNTYAQRFPAASLSSARAPWMKSVVLLGRLTDMRLNGRAHEADYLLGLMDASLGPAGSIVSDGKGFGVMLPLQAGITAMLGGHLKLALDYFARAQIQPMIPGLSFLTRDAYAKEALVHAVFDRTKQAKRALRKAASVPVVGSWVEPVIEATEQLAQVMINIEEGVCGVELLDDIALHAVGEMWPFYVICLRRALGHAGQHLELLQRVSVLEKMPFPRVDGEGLAGSVFPLARATVSLLVGDLESARRSLGRADPECVCSLVMLIEIELAAGRPQEAIKASGRLGDAAWAGLWRVDLWRLVALSAAYVELKRIDEAREALTLVLQKGLSDRDYCYFSEPVLDFAVEHIEGWPERDRSQPQLAAILPDVRLTGREFEILRLLAEKRPLKSMADELFISVNTLKTHVKAIYRKLEVSSRDAAILRAEREGWV